MVGLQEWQKSCSHVGHPRAPSESSWRVNACITTLLPCPSSTFLFSLLGEILKQESQPKQWSLQQLRLLLLLCLSFWPFPRSCCLLRATHQCRPLHVWAFKVPFSPPGQLLLISAGSAQGSLPLGSPCHRSLVQSQLLLLWPSMVICVSLPLLLSDYQGRIQFISSSSTSVCWLLEGKGSFLVSLSLINHRSFLKE